MFISTQAREAYKTLILAIDENGGTTLCAQTDPELFFPEKGGSTEAAKKLCEKCPVKTECLAFGLANREPYGVFGGLSTRQRDRLLSYRRPLAS
jgi:WhiB family redox-sensing transcriptional regulator